jgi:PST family polysaccharide transporter
MTIFTSWWYSRKIRQHTPSMSPVELGQEVAPLLTLGFAFMASGLMTMGVAYAVRITVLHKVGYEATGLYQSAWTLGGLYVAFILQAMGADFYPRLTAHANDNAVCNRLVNEQAHVGLLLAVPGVIATLTLAPVVIALLYSSKFAPAVGLLRWICLGVTLQVITWPMGFIIIAKGRQKIFLACELAWTVVSLGLAWSCINTFGLNGAGIAFFASYAFHAILLYPIVHRLSGFRCSAKTAGTALFFVGLVTLVFCGFYMLPLLWATLIGVLALIASGYYSVRSLLALVSTDLVPRSWMRLLARLRVAPSPTLSNTVTPTSDKIEFQQ